MRNRRYAGDTNVSPEKSQMEIQQTLVRYGASSFMSGSDQKSGKSMIAFEKNGRRVRFVIPSPNPEEFKRNSAGSRVSDGQAKQAYEKAIRQRWRALALAVKAKLEVVASGMMTFEDEFLAHIVLPNGSTVGDMVQPQIEKSYHDGKMPPLLGYEK